MRISRGIAAILCAAPLAGCAVFGPELDRAMDDAPAIACAEPSGFLVLAPDQRSWVPFGAAAIPAGTEVLALPGGTGRYTHVVLTGDSAGAGAMQVAVPDSLARGDRGRILRWRAPRQRWTVANIGTALHHPAGVRIAVLAGEVRIDRVCFKSYLRAPVPRPPEEGEAHDDEPAH
ncbi:MAG: hypothetical protein QOD42_196 [Sphingomonadales bacterium]|nr:hypothetical protein [Sphingomonadales bacterium]